MSTNKIQSPAPRPSMLRRFGASLLGLVGVGGNRFKARLEKEKPPEMDPKSAKAHDAALKPKKQKIHRINLKCGEDTNPLITCKGNGRQHIHKGGIYAGQFR